MDKVVITIGREYGSGGAAIGRKLAERLGIPFYDHELLNKAMAESDVDPVLSELCDEQPIKSLLFSMVMNAQQYKSAMPVLDRGVPRPSLEKKIFQVQQKVEREIAEKSSCVMVGRCSNYALRDMAEHFSIFIHASMDARIREIMRRENVPEKKARLMILERDKERKNYYNYYTGGHWGNASDYQFCIDSSMFSQTQIISLIISALSFKKENL